MAASSYYLRQTHAPDCACSVCWSARQVVAPLCSQSPC
ncbi:lysogeny maintenance protein PflM, partial [Pseudomonas aeruginosa]